MSLHPRNLLLAVLFAGLVAANLALERPANVAQQRGALVPDFDPARVQRVVLTCPQDPPLVILREADGWRLPGQENFRAFDHAVDRLLDQVAALQRGDRVAEESMSFDLYGVGAAGRSLRFEDAEGRSLCELVQGVSASMLAGSNVRLSAGVDVFRAFQLDPVHCSAGAWLDTRLLDFEPGQVRGFTVSHDGGRVLLELRRDGAGWVLLEGGARRGASRARIERLLEVASTLVFTDLESQGGRGDDDDLVGQAQTVLELELGEEEQAAVWIGSRAAEGSYPATNPAWRGAPRVRLDAMTAHVLFDAIEGLADSLR